MFKYKQNLELLKLVEEYTGDKTKYNPIGWLLKINKLHNACTKNIFAKTEMKVAQKKKAEFKIGLRNPELFERKHNFTKTEIIDMQKKSDKKNKNNQQKYR